MSGDFGFTTERLVAREWHEAAQRDGSVNLPAVVAEMLTEPVTRWLPPSWQGPYTHARASAWIAEQDSEGPVLLVSGRADARPLGLVLLFMEPVDGGIDVRLGYLLAEHAWGRGFGSELLGGIVAWCGEQPDVRSIIGGVARENTASIRLLERHGFVREMTEEPAVEYSYRMRLPA